MNKEYLGDGCYIEYDINQQMFRLFTSDGIKDTNIIYLEKPIGFNLFSFLKRHNIEGN